MNWKFWERREYTDAVIDHLTDRATGDTTPARITATAALETAVGLISRAFASATVEADDHIKTILTPEVMATIGRGLVRNGELLYRISVDDGLMIQPAVGYEISGGPDPRSWQYSLHIAGPSDTVLVENLMSESVIHLRYACDPGRPWRGLSPLGIANLTGRLSAAATQALGDEVQGPRAQIIGIPTDGDDVTVRTLKNDIRTARGNALLMEAGDWDVQGSQNHASYEPKRLGANPPASLVNLHDSVRNEVLGCCGVPPILYGNAGQAAGLREAYRLLLHSTVAPLGMLVAVELSAKLDTQIKFDWSELRAGDMAGAARAFQSLVGGGMAVERAASLSGLMASE